MVSLITFPSTHQAMEAEILTEPLGKTRLVSLPPAIDAGCGLSLLVEEGDIEAIVRHLRKEGIAMEGVYEKLDVHDFRKLEIP